MPYKTPAAVELDGDLDCNPSGKPHIQDILQARLTRRQALLGSASLASVSVLAGLGLVGCKDGDSDDLIIASGSTGNPAPAPLSLGFNAVPKNLNDIVTVPAGYNVNVLYALGDPIDNATTAWADNGVETGASYNQRAGDHQDGIYYFGLSATSQPSPTASDRGLLCMNHEALNSFNSSTGANALYIHPTGATVASGVRTVPDEVVKEINCHGVSVIEIKKNGLGQFELIKGSTFNRRTTAVTEMELTGPARGSDFVKTKFSPNGTRTRGTVNNCANGYTPWGTYLTCEENYEGYFARAPTTTPAPPRARMHPATSSGTSSAGGKLATTRRRPASPGTFLCLAPRPTRTRTTSIFPDSPPRMISPARTASGLDAAVTPRAACSGSRPTTEPTRM